MLRIIKNLMQPALTFDHFAIMLTPFCGLSKRRKQNLITHIRARNTRKFNQLINIIMKKTKISNTRYNVVVRFVYENGDHEFMEEKNVTLNEAKRAYISFSNSIGEEIHTWNKTRIFYGKAKGAINGRCGGCFIEEVTPIMFM